MHDVGKLGVPEAILNKPAKLTDEEWEIMPMCRSYKEPRTHEDAIKIIEEVAGTQLDRELVDIFLTIPKEELERCIPEQVKY